MSSRLGLLLLLVAGIFLPFFSPHRIATAVRTTPFAYGVSVGDLANTQYVSDMGFNYMKVTLSWARSEPSKGQYQWLSGANDADNIANAAQARGIKLLLRVDNPPAWANGGGGTAAPANMNDFGDFLYALSVRLRGKVAAYEIWNEPNLAIEWGGAAVDPERYALMLRTVYPRIKAGDSNALVVSAGLATNGEGGGWALDDLAFIQRMYNAGARPYFDVLGSHPYGFAYPPEYDPGAAWGLAFRRAEQQYAVMVANGDAGKQVWATELGWLLNPPDRSCDWPDRNWQKVSEQTQADYLVRAYQYAVDNWPWMGAMFVFNLDFAASYYQAGCPGNTDMCNPMRYYSMTYRDNPCSPGTNVIKFRPAYWSLRSMPKSALDALAPSSSMNPLAPTQARTWFIVSWQGSDSQSGVAYYDVEYKEGSSGTWRSWYSNTAGTVGIFTRGVAGRTYYFRARAVDNAGNVQPFPTSSSAWVSTTAGNDSSGLRRINIPLAMK